MDNKVLKWNFIFQYGWVFTNLVNSIILLPVYVRNIDSGTLGIWLATGSVLAWMTLVDPGVGEVLQQRIAEHCGSGQHEEVGKLIGSGLIASVIVLLVAAVFGFACYFSLGAIIDKDISQYPGLPLALMLSLIATGLSLVSFSISGINQGIHNAMPVAVASLSANFLFLLINLGLLVMGFGILSIALANLAKNIYINAYNIVALRHTLKEKNWRIIYNKKHFSRFIRIFSFTSASKIVSGLAYSVDMIVLARFIPPSMITVYEINKRPINMTNSFVARHSVALMPSISHAKGEDDHAAITRLIDTHFKFYYYAAIFTAILFPLVYRDLITAWGGKGNYAGDTITWLLTSYSFIGLICYYMSNVGYALGDIRANSLFNLVKNFIYGILLFFAAKHYGIIGTLVVSISLALMADLFFFSWRVHRLGYLRSTLVSSTAKRWALMIPGCAVAAFGIHWLVGQLFPATANIPRLLTAAAAFTGFFAVLLPLSDSEIRASLKHWRGRMILRFS